MPSFSFGRTTMLDKKLLRTAIFATAVGLSAYIGHVIGTRQMIKIYGDVLDAEMITYLAEIDLNK